MDGLDLLGILQLPLRPSEEDEAFQRLVSQVPDGFEDFGDYCLAVIEDFDHWCVTDQCSKWLDGAVSVLLTGTEVDSLGIDGKVYFQLHRKLCRGGKRDWRGLDHQTARRLLSRSTFVHQMLSDEQMSASQIARLFAALESSLDVSYKAIQVLARQFGILPEITSRQLHDSIWPRDSKRALNLFTDVSIEESCVLCGEILERWFADTSLPNYLGLLTAGLRRGEATSWPYLQILHWCCVPLELFDHPPSHLYEFNARGKIATDLFAKYSNVATGNPVLNNAKAIAKLDEHWARNRSGDDAHALVRILSLLESLPFLVRREAARVIRAWLVRLVEQAEDTLVPLCADSQESVFWRLANVISKSETRTKGVLEQRLVDALSVLAFGGIGWRERGLGDSVNASNLSKRKLGDVEFANVALREAIALEAHGGTVTQSYVEGHRKSLMRIVEKRLEESWMSIDSPEHWHIRLIFIAHSYSGDLPTHDMMSGVRVTYEYWNYDQLIEEAITHEIVESVPQVVSDYVFVPLNRQVVPQWIRDRTQKIIDGIEGED